MKIRNVVAVVAAVVLIGGCATSGEKACQKTRQNAGGQPALKVAVFADRGSAGIGALEWFRLVDESPEMELKLVDGQAVRDGVLEGQDLFVMPGGSSKKEFDSLGTNGVERMKEFLRKGGGYVGTCAGCCLLMDGPFKRARIMPWNSSGSESATMFPTINVNAKGAAALGVKEGPHVVRYHGGPFLWATGNTIPDANIEIWGTFDAEATLKGPLNIKKKMYGAGAIVGGSYGKGRVFATSAHPEYFNSTLYLVKGAIEYVTGRKVTFPQRLRSPGAISVGFLASGISGVETAATAVELSKEKDMDVEFIDIDGIKRRRLDHIDVLVVASDYSKKNKYLEDAMKEFAAAGGKTVGFGAGADVLPAGGVKCQPRGAVAKAIRSVMGR